MTLGSPFFEGYVPDFDATIVTRLLEAGATITGKMNMEPFSFGAGTAGPRGFGRVLNPHDRARSSGGSSSGSAAALAAREIDLAVGGDQGGSVRIPAAWCGVVGLKATHGLIPHTGVFGSEASVDHVGPMTRTVRDMALMLSSISGSDPYDPRQRNVPPGPDFDAQLDRGVKGFRIGGVQEGFGVGDADVDDLVMSAVDVVSRCGAVVKKVSWPIHNLTLVASIPLFLKGSLLYDTNLAGPISGTWSPTSFITEVGKRMAERPEDIPLVLKYGIIAGRYVHSKTHGRYASLSENMRNTFVDELDRVFETVDVLAMPTVPIKAPVFEEGDALELKLLGGGGADNAPCA